MYGDSVLTRLVVAVLLPASPQFVAGDDVDLGFRVAAGTYTVSVRLPCIGRRSLTLDTGASYTVLDRGAIAGMAGVVVHPTAIHLVLPYESTAVPASFVTVPWIQIGDCILHDRRVVVADLPGDRHGALGMNDLEALAPFTFIGNGVFRFQCPSTLVTWE